MQAVAHNPAFAKKDKAERLKIINDVTTKPQRMEIVDKVFTTKKMKGGGLYENINAKRERIAKGSGERCVEWVAKVRQRLKPSSNPPEQLK